MSYKKYMAKPQRTFDFIAILPHGGGRTAMQNYLQCCGAKFTLFSQQQSPTQLQAWINNNQHQHIGLILDHSGRFLPIEVVRLAVPNFPLLLMSRDIIGYVRSLHNHTLRRWADSYTGLFVPEAKVIKSESYVNFPADVISERINDCLRRVHTHWHKVLAALRVFAGSVTVVDFSDFTTPGALPEIMHKVSGALFNNQAPWNGFMMDAPITSTTNVIFHRLPVLQLRDSNSHFSCALSPWPCEFWIFMKQDAELLAGSYPPESIDWRIGEFNGDLGFYCDEQEIVASGLSKQEFVSRASILLSDARERSKNYAEFLQQQPTYYRNQNGGVFDDYVREIHARVAKADELFAQVQTTPEQIIETIHGLGASVLEQYRGIIRSQAEELASVGVDVRDRWVHARELLGPDGFSRPLDQRSSHLRALIRELVVKEGEATRRTVDLKAERDTLQVKYDQVRKELEEEKQRRQKLKASLSWRVTKPLRWLSCQRQRLRDTLRRRKNQFHP